MRSSEKSLQKQYKVILDSITDGVYTMNLEWRITSFNKAAERVTGIPVGEAIGRPCFEVFRSNICEKDCLIRETLKTRKVLVNRPLYIIRSDKKRIPICATTAVLKDMGGKTIGGVVTFRDLTDLSTLRRELLKQHSFEDIISKNAKMLKIFSILPQIAQSSSTVLIEGASGTGKELIARAIHHHSFNRRGPFIAVNCGALPDTLVESELFGYKAGAFTDAKRDKPGRFAQAQNGTILLDEIGDISLAVQVRLLRILEQKNYEPLGATKAYHTNARVIAATHHDLNQLVKAGKFRRDLYYRINVVKLTLPALVERKEDIPLLVDHFIQRFNRLNVRNIMGVSREAMAALMLHDWPGNVRELENAIEHAFVICQEELIRLEHLPEQIIPARNHRPITIGSTLKEIEKQAIEQSLERNNWKKVATARELGIDKNTLRRKIIRLGIKTPS